MIDMLSKNYVFYAFSDSPNQIHGVPISEWDEFKKNLDYNFQKYIVITK